MARLNTIIPGRITDANDNPISNGYVYTYAAGTTTAKATYSDRELATANTNPLRTNAGGEPTSSGTVVDIYLGSGLYKVVIKDSNGATLRTYDEVEGDGDVASGAYVNVRDYGDGTGRDAIKAAVDDAVASNIGTVFYPPGDYHASPWVTGAEQVTHELAEGAAILDTTNVFAKHKTPRMTAQVWEPTVIQGATLDTKDYYNHQPYPVFDLDGELMLVFNSNPYTNIEGANYRTVVYAKTNDSGAWQSIGSTFVDFPADSSVNNNPITFSSGTPRLGSTFGLNFLPYGLGSKVWLGFSTDQGRAETEGRLFVCQKTSAAGKLTTYSFWQNTSTGAISLFQGESRPATGYTSYFAHEGFASWAPFCHGIRIDSRGRLLLFLILLDGNDSFSAARRIPCVLYCDDPSSNDPTALTWTLGPSIPLGRAQGPAGLWEFDLDEQDKDYFVGLLRNNELLFDSGLSHRGWRQLSFDGDGTSFSALQPGAIAAHRTRPGIARVGPNLMIVDLYDRISARSAMAAFFRVRNGAWVHGPVVSNEEPQRVAEQTFVATTTTDTIYTATELTFTGAEIRVEQNTDTLVYHGRVTDYSAPGTIDLSSWVYHNAGDSFVVDTTTPETLTIATSTDNLVWTLGGSNSLATANEVIYHKAVVGLTYTVSEQQVYPTTGSQIVTFRANTPVAEEDVITVRSTTGFTAQIPMVRLDPTTGRIVFVWCHHDTKSGGGGNPRISYIEPDDIPRPDQLVVALRGNAAAELGSDHQPTYASGIITNPGSGSSAMGLPDISGHCRYLYKVVGTPTALYPSIPLILGNFQECIRVEVAPKQGAAATGLYERRYYRVHWGGGRSEIGEDELIGIDPEENVGVWQPIEFQYDAQRGKVYIGERIINLNPPYFCLFGDGYLNYYENTPTSQQLLIDVSSILWTALPENYQWRGLRDSERDGGNLIKDPMFWWDPERGGSSPYTLTSNTPTLPGVYINSAGGATGTLRLAVNSQNAAVNAFSGVPNRLNVSVSVAGTNWTEIDFIIDDVRRVLPGTYQLEMDMVNNLTPTGDPIERGVGVRVTAVYNLGFGGEKTWTLGQLRVLRTERRNILECVIPPFEERNNRIITETGGYFKLRFGFEAGLTYSIDIRRIDFGMRRGPRQFRAPNWEDVEAAVEREYFVWGRTQLNSTATPVIMADAIAHTTTGAQFLVEMPAGGMRETPSDSVTGTFAAFDAGLTAHTGSVSMVALEGDNALMEIYGFTNTVAAGDVLTIRPVSPDVQSITGNDTVYRSQITFPAYEEDDIIVVSSGTNTLSAGEDYWLKANYQNQYDKLIVDASGDSTLVSNVSLTSLSGASLLRFNTTSGEETLTPGTSNQWIYTGTLGAYTLTLLSGGSTVAAGSGNEYDLVTATPTRYPAIMLASRVATGNTVTVTSTKYSNAAVVFDARLDHTNTQYLAATSTALAAMSGVTAKRAAQLDVLIRKLTNAGIWAKADVIFLPANFNEASAKVNLITPGTFNLTATNSPTFTADYGWTTNGVDSYVASTYNPSTDATNFAQDDATVAVYILDEAPLGIANWVIGDTGIGFIPRTNEATSRFFSRLNDGTTNEGKSVYQGLSAQGLSVLTRAAAGSYTVGQQRLSGQIRRQTITQTSTGLPNVTVQFGKRSTAYGAGTVGFYYLGAALTLTQENILRRTVEEYLYDIGTIAPTTIDSTFDDDDL